MKDDITGTHENTFFSNLFEVLKPIASRYEKIDFSSRHEMVDKKQFFHYTSLGGFMKIVESRELWMTQIDYLNDASEFSEFCQSFEYNRVDRKEQGKETTDFDRFLSGIQSVDEATREAAGRVFIASFSSLPNSLNQWRAYGSDAGVSIGFSLENIMKMSIKNVDSKFVRCSYKAEEQDEVCNIIINFLESINNGEFSKKIPRSYLYASKKIRETVHFFLAMLAPCFKNPAFHEEKEFRLIGSVISRNSQENLVRYRIKNNLIVPYVCIPLEDPETKKLLINSVRIGPGNFQEKNVAAIRKMLEEKGEDIRVRGSIIPFRNI